MFNEKISKRQLPLTDEEFKNIYSKVPKVTVECVLKTSSGVVLTKREKYGWEGMWHTPGGTVFYREKLKDAVVRIAQEELGLKVKVGEMLDCLEFMSEEKERGFGYSISLAYGCTTKDKIPEKTLQGEEVKVWNLVPDLIVPEHRALVEKMLKA